MCSKKWAKPDLPGSTSLREPVCTGICSETMFGKPVGTTITRRPLASVASVAWNGMMSSACGLMTLVRVAAPADIATVIARTATVRYLRMVRCARVLRDGEAGAYAGLAHCTGTAAPALPPYLETSQIASQESTKPGTSS